MHEYDKSSKWLIQHHGDSILRLAGVKDVVAWRPLQAEVVQPRQLPDGLLEVEFANESEPDVFILELATYPEERLREQVARDMMLVWLDRRKLPEVVAVILHPRGNVPAANEMSLESPHGFSRCNLNWRVVELWNVPAEDLFAADDVGLIPWVPLTRHSEPVEQVLQECRERIDRSASADERANLLAVTQVMTRLRYNQENLLSILGGSQVMIESPLIQEIVVRRDKKLILAMLEGRFGPVPAELVNELYAIQDEDSLLLLAKKGWSCPNLDAFRTLIRELPIASM